MLQKKMVLFFLKCGIIYLVIDVKKFNIILIIAILFFCVNVEAKELGLNILDTTSTISCSGYFGDANTEGTLMNLLVRGIFIPIRFVVPILFLGLTTWDFSKVVFTDSKDGMEKAKKNFVKRALIAVIIFFIPTILEILFQFVDSQAIKACMNNF